MQAPLQPFVERVLSRLQQFKSQEPDPWLRDDLHIAYLTVLYAARGDAVCCAPQVLATYQVLGLHPDKVWPRIFARKLALGLLDEECAPPPKKPAQSVKLWPEKTIAARLSRSCGGEAILGESREPMSAIVAAYPNSGGPESAKNTPAFKEEELKEFFETCPPELVETRVLRTIESMWNAVGKALGKKPFGTRVQFFLSIDCYRTNRYRSASAVRYNLRRAERAGHLHVDYRDDLGRCHHIWVRPRSKSDRGDYRRVPTYSLSIPLLLKWREWKRTGKLHAEPLPIRKPSEPVRPADPPPSTAKPAAEHPEHRGTRRVTRDERLALFSAYIALKKSGMANETAIAEVQRQFKNRFTAEDIELAVKILGAKNADRNERQRGFDSQEYRRLVRGLRNAKEAGIGSGRSGEEIFERACQMEGIPLQRGYELWERMNGEEEESPPS